MKSLCFLALILTSVVAQSALSVTELTNGVTVNSALALLTTTYDNVDLYRIFVPANASSVSVNFANNDNDNCDYIRLLIRTGGAPCSDDTFYSEEFLCANPADPGNGIAGNLTYTIDAYDYSDNLLEFKPNDYLFIGITRYSSYDFTCPYSLSVNIVENCAAGTTTFEDSDSQSCLTYVNATSGSTYAANSGTTSNTNIYKLSIPQGTGNIHAVFNSSNGSPYLVGRSYSAPSSTDGNCYLSSGDSIGDFVIYDLYCLDPRAGDFYFSIYSSSAYTGSVTFNVQVCANNTGGYNCTLPSFAINATTFGTPGAIGDRTIFVPYNSATQDYDDAFAYYYVDIPAGFVGPQVQFIATAVTGSGYVYIRRDGYPGDSSTYGYEDSSEYTSISTGSYESFYLNNYEYVEPGRIYIGLQCTSSSGSGCNFTLTSNYTALASTTANTGASTANTGASTANTGASTASTGASTAASTGASTRGSTSSNSGSGSTTSSAPANAVPFFAWWAIVAIVVAALL